jgi:hypothetical protein
MAVQPARRNVADGPEDRTGDGLWPHRNRGYAFRVPSPASDKWHRLECPGLRGDPPGIAAAERFSGSGEGCH